MGKERLAKINELIKRELGVIIQREFEHSAKEFITITEVETSHDLLHSKIKVSIWPDRVRDDIFLRLKNAAGFFQDLLNKKLKMRPVPKIVFELDKRVAEAGRVEELLKEANRSNQ